MGFIDGIDRQCVRQARAHLLPLMCTAAVGLLLFYRLGDLSLDPDEGRIIEWTNILLAENPTILGLFVSFVKNGGLVPLGEIVDYRQLYPGINIYLTALSFHVFGVSIWAARLPSAVIGLFTVPVFYASARRLLPTGMSPQIGLLLFATSAPLLFLMRQARYTSTTVLMTLLLVLAYLAVLERKRFALIYLSIVSLLFFYTAYYVFCPVALGLVCHALAFTSASVRKRVAVLFCLLLLCITLAGAVLQLGPIWFLDTIGYILSRRAPIMVLNNLHLAAFEMNLLGIPFVLAVIYLGCLGPGGRRDPQFFTAIGLWAVFMIMQSSFGAVLCGYASGVLNPVWPYRGGWLQNRLVDPRSWSVICLCSGAFMVVQGLRKTTSSDAKLLAIPVIMVMGAIAGYSLLYPSIWTRYVACLVVLAFIPGAYMLEHILVRQKLVGYALIVLLIGTNLLSVVPFSSGHYPYLDWKLPHWTYRLFSDDPISEVIYNFYTDHRQVNAGVPNE
ncbi:MAG: hypothetical protein HOH43_05440 [Candidatus Latescibacteria bacterium]|nr:hypothetical protein [Candidatus Latescibacterota bacterium]